MRPVFARQPAEALATAGHRREESSPGHSDGPLRLANEGRPEEPRTADSGKIRRHQPRRLARGEIARNSI